ncbi:MAG: undecaprenyl-diphosphate phosphatase [Candidatus Izemoplasmatales bacterium]|jgi:undecaprenyl-diphosphatase|nr:undecaprenyl-diphosphate phosphatase [bacterium]MDZ4195948.1 undecaprenyl-diphosphate phosphatase [Candidatus Izemoplasmatales bacterium]
MEIVKVIIETIKYIFLGLIQGLTEVIPVSSSGHVKMAQQLLNITIDEGLLFLILVNTGSLIAFLYHFRTLIIRIVGNFFKYIFVKDTREFSKEDFEYLMKIVVASIPAAVIGFLFSDVFDQIYLEYGLVLVGTGLLITATVLYVARDYSSINGRQTVSMKDAITIGFFQMFALIPGLSRNGVTTSTGLFRKMSMETSLVFSLLLSIPLSIGSLLNYILKIFIQGEASDLGFDVTNIAQYIFYFFAFIASILATLIALKYIFIFFRRGKLVYFSLYLFAVGLIALFYGLINL